jgi:hypothetical protein
MGGQSKKKTFSLKKAKQKQETGEDKKRLRLFFKRAGHISLFKIKKRDVACINFCNTIFLPVKDRICNKK